MTVLYGAAASFAAACALQAAVRLRQDRSVMRVMPVLSLLAAAAALALTAATPALAQAQPAGPAVAWTGSTLGLLATWLFLGVLATVTGHTDRHRTLLAIPVLGAASAGLLQIAFRAPPGTGPPSALPALAAQLALQTYYCPALCRIAALGWQCSRRIRVRHISAGMRAVSSAAAVQLVLVLARSAAIIGRSSGTPLAEPEMVAIASAQAVAAIQLIGGATVSVWFPVLVRLCRQGRLWWTYWRLHRLWAALRQTVPQVELPPPPGMRFSIRYRLYRRVIEIRDGELALRPHSRRDVADKAAAAAQSAGLAPGSRSAVVEAAVIMTALKANRQGAPASDDNVPADYISAAAGNDLHAEAARLLLVARAARHSRIVQELSRQPGRGVSPARWAARHLVRRQAGESD